MRLQRAMARAGVASRRRSEDLIRAGKVRVNGEIATIGSLVDPSQDTIVVGGDAVRQVREATLMLHKPIGCVVSRRDPEGRETVFGMVPEIPGLTYVGRLDFMTSGLLILTTNGELANRLTHPKFQVPRTYQVLVRGRPTEKIRRELSHPITIDDRDVAMTRADVSSMGRGRSQIIFTLVEGRNRIVRKMCEAIGVTVERLERISHGPITLGSLKERAWRYLSDLEFQKLEKLGSGR